MIRSATSSECSTQSVVCEMTPTSRRCAPVTPGKMRRKRWRSDAGFFEGTRTNHNARCFSSGDAPSYRGRGKWRCTRCPPWMAEEGEYNGVTAVVIEARAFVHRAAGDCG